VNLGATRADALVWLKLEGRCADVLEQLEAALALATGTAIGYASPPEIPGSVAP
jgi:hypothetical protein